MPSNFFELPAVPVLGSPSLADLSLNEQINYFEDKVNRWILEPCAVLLKADNPDWDFAVLTILNAVPEMIAQYQGCIGEKKNLYKTGFEYIFGEEIDFIPNHLYAHLRSAISHTALTGEGITLSRERQNLAWPICRSKSLYTVVINVPEWYSKTRDRLTDYIEELRDFEDSDKDELRNAFSQRIVRHN